MTALPHLFMVADVEIDGIRAQGIAAESLAPKWFTKDPEAHYAAEIADMLAVITSAAGIAVELGPNSTVFDLWHQVYKQQEALARTTRYPPLLWNFGISVIERAMLDAFCKATETPFAAAIKKNTLGFDLGRIHPELVGLEPGHLLPAPAAQTIHVRHTISLFDPLTDADIPANERLNDGLPQSLLESIAAYGISYFKIKVYGDVDQDIKRLKQIRAAFDSSGIVTYQFTLDGNEQFYDVATFKTFWEKFVELDDAVPDIANLIFVEQPLHRSVALTKETGTALQEWRVRPPMIIDEADADLTTFRTALDCGYVGTSHKNCKGVFKGIANACYAAYRRQQHPEQITLLSGEDLANVGPVALLQDLAVMATLGLDHVERNGHYYFRGLSMFQQPVQDATQNAHPDLYKQHEQGFPALNIHAGRIQLGSVLESPFGTGFDLNPADHFIDANNWAYRTLELP